jgi:hypothetical protein
MDWTKLSSSATAALIAVPATIATPVAVANVAG